MREIATSAVNRQRTWKLPIPIAVNLLLGIPAIVPILLGWRLMVNGPLAELGWTQRDPTADDGMVPMLIVIVPVICLFGLPWGLANAWMRSRTAALTSVYWLACVAATFVPFFADFLLF